MIVSRVDRPLEGARRRSTSCWGRCWTGREMEVRERERKEEEGRERERERERGREADLASCPRKLNCVPESDCVLQIFVNLLQN